MILEKNICPCERIVRIVVGLIIASFAFWGPKNVWFLLGLIPVVVGAIGYCPAYAVFGWNTAVSCRTSCRCQKKE